MTKLTVGQEDLFFLDVAGQLLRSADRASLGTLMPTEGAPYVSMVMMALADDSAPILLLSRLAQHTTNLLADGQASLLLDGTAGLAEPLTGPRLTLQGHLSTTVQPEDAAAYLRRHPGAAAYADWADFSFFRMRVARAHLVAGFGKIRWLEWPDLQGVR